jgi:hypothetical protein
MQNPRKTAMLEKLIIHLERLQTHLYHSHERKRRERSLRSAKLEITRLARLRLL